MTWKLLGGDPLKEVFLGSFWTHHSLVVDLNHLVACVDLLTLVGWRLQRHRETGRQEEQRQRSESHWRAWSSLLDYRTDPTQETTESVWKVEEKIQKGISLNFLNGPIRFVTVRLATVQLGASYLLKEQLPARRKSEYEVCNPTNPVGGEARNMFTAPWVLFAFNVEQKTSSSVISTIFSGVESPTVKKNFFFFCCFFFIYYYLNISWLIGIQNNLKTDWNSFFAKFQGWKLSDVAAV